MAKKIIYGLIISLLFLVTLVTTSVSAQPYIGSYLNFGYVTTTKVIFCCNFGTTPYGQIPSNNALKAVPSVAGGTSAGQTTGDIFQGGLHLKRSGTVEFVPQQWHGGTKQWISSPTNVGTYSYSLIFSKMIMDTANNRVQYKVYAYPDSWSVEHDAPTIYTISQVPIPSGNTKFLAGTRTLGSVKFKYFQVGVESVSELTIAWMVQESRISYYTGSAWLYQQGRVCYRSSSALTNISSTAYAPGSSNYPNVKLYYNSIDYVAWQRGTPVVRDNTLLWSGSGTPDMTVTLPFS